MRKIILSTVAMALIAASASQALAAQHHARKAPQATSEQFRNARNAVEQPSQPGWQYSGWSAPAGR
ncbi:hypothetical protein JQ594_21090 [Bradyrhizobium manausense]|uniref:hypothetical protein n=1 Tax=Bradyrhizobium manausense TaxID=989370 RepID=UPI001BAA6412|nr:hypothetical protein [Bradyrhizobium manausense]MBR0688435.1 hypothetical protein [Bradyrhizobium manausense]MBR0720907.1 hypothetical protein [Bradyrhizobium manausense]